jgi:hypothetical protein
MFLGLRRLVIYTRSRLYVVGTDKEHSIEGEKFNINIDHDWSDSANRPPAFPCLVHMVQRCMYTVGSTTSM